MDPNNTLSRSNGHILFMQNKNQLYALLEKIVEINYGL